MSSDPVSAAFAASLGRLRRSRGLSFQQLGRLAGLHAASVSAIEAGKTGATLHSAGRLAAALGVPLPEMLAAGREAAQ